MNNDHMTMDELADIAESIINEEPLKEDIFDSLKSFAGNYRDMRETLVELQKYLLTKAKEHNKKSRLMGDGSYLKALNASKKVNIQLEKMNKEARMFVKFMKEAVK